MTTTELIALDQMAIDNSIKRQPFNPNEKTGAAIHRNVLALAFKDGYRAAEATNAKTIFALTARVEACERDAERWKEAKSIFYDVVPGDKCHYAWKGEMRSWNVEGSVMLPFRYLPKDMSITQLIDLSIRGRKKEARIDAALNAKDGSP